MFPSVIVGDNEGIGNSSNDGRSEAAALKERELSMAAV